MERAVEVAILLLAPWPVARLIAAPAFHRRLAAHPGRLAALASGAGGYVAAVGLLAAGPPWPLRAAALAALAATALGWWRARPAYGRGRGLPPGSLAMAQLGLLQDDRFLLGQAARHGPVFKVARYGRPIACVVGLERGAELLRRAGDDLGSGPLPFSRLIPGGFLRYMGPADNARYRALIARALPPELVRGTLRPRVEAAAERAFAALAAASGAARDGVPPGPHLRRLTYEVMLGALFGLGPGDPRSARLLELYPSVESATLARAGARRAHAAMAEITGIVAEAAADAGRRAAGPPGCALDLLARGEPDALADPTLLGNLVYLAETGGRDIADLLCWALKLLGDNPQWARRLAADAAATPAGGAAEDGLAGRVVAETLRLEQSEYVVRTALRPVRVAGFAVPAGWLVRICVRESHRDPAAFPDPDRFDPDRFQGASRPDARSYAPLGLGRHACLGRTLVEVTAATSLAVLARGFDWRVAVDGPREFGTFHWMPSGRFRVAATARPAAARNGGPSAGV